MQAEHLPPTLSMRVLTFAAEERANSLHRKLVQRLFGCVRVGFRLSSYEQHVAEPKFRRWRGAAGNRQPVVRTSVASGSRLVALAAMP